MHRRINSDPLAAWRLPETWEPMSTDQDHDYGLGSLDRNSLDLDFDTLSPTGGRTEPMSFEPSSKPLDFNFFETGAGQHPKITERQNSWEDTSFRGDFDPTRLTQVLNQSQFPPVSSLKPMNSPAEKTKKKGHRRTASEPVAAFFTSFPEHGLTQQESLHSSASATTIDVSMTTVAPPLKHKDKNIDDHGELSFTTSKMTTTGMPSLLSPPPPPPHQIQHILTSSPTSGQGGVETTTYGMPLQTGPQQTNFQFHPSIPNPGLTTTTTTTNNNNNTNSPVSTQTTINNHPASISSSQQQQIDLFFYGNHPSPPTPPKPQSTHQQLNIQQQQQQQQQQHKLQQQQQQLQQQHQLLILQQQQAELVKQQEKKLYKCSRCGEIKANHICKYVKHDSVAIGLQADPSILVQTQGHTTITVRRPRSVP